MAGPTQKIVYNAPRFKVKQYDFDVFSGPAAGQCASEFTVHDQDGTPVTLSDFRGKWVVLETGSATCSMYTKNIKRMRELRKEHPDVEFLVIYVREAHPGERRRQHESLEDKIAASKMLPERYGEDRRILVDTFDGEFHRAYGGMPNILYVINPQGTVHHRCDWAVVEELRTALEDRERPHMLEHADSKKLRASRGMLTALRTMWTGGVLALWDFVRALPKLHERHKQVDEYYAKHGKFKRRPGAKPAE